MKNFSTEKYIGIPYQEKGRTFSGVDCWGLACLVYKTEFDIDLPSYDEHYELNSEEDIAELIAREKEGWQPVEIPEVGDLALFKIFGHAAHVGIVVDSRTYLEVRENRDTVLERFDSPTSKKRLVGYFRYKQNCSAIPVVGAPHPLRTRVTRIAVPAGLSVRSVVQDIEKYSQTPEEYQAKIKIFLNGKPILEESWDSTYVKEGDQVEYRILPGKKYLAPIVLIAAAILAPQLATSALQFSANTAAAYGATIGATLGATIYYGTYAATLLIGSALAAKISPIRPPTEPRDPGTSERALMFSGAANQINPYGTIPVVLGRVRTTPLLGAVPNIYYNGAELINLLAIWGYGPLHIDTSTFRIGDIPLSNYLVDGGKQATISYEPGTGSSILNNEFDRIYGQDYDVVPSGIELACPGLPNEYTQLGNWVQVSSAQPGNYRVDLQIHFPQGARGVITRGDDAGYTENPLVIFRIEKSQDGLNWDLHQFFTVNSQSHNGITKVISLNTEPNASYEWKFVRIRRDTGSSTGTTSDRVIYYHESILTRAVFTANRRPIRDPKNCQLAKTAIELVATDRINGNLQGFNGIVHTWGKKWSGTGWQIGTINNPGELFRYVLEHPANPRRITSEDQLDLQQIAHFCDYCNQNGFTYNAIMGSQKSVLEVLRDICASGRASPALMDGKWTVVIDEPKPVTQHFTPHNSWGFEASKALPRYPHAIRVNFYDEDQDYQEVETIVYDNGYSEQNASLFESITLPGVTKKTQVVDHVKWHFAQIKLRPEVYTFNTDIEYLVCSRGDRVKVTHYVPLWGRGSGRISEKISNIEYKLDEAVYMEANKPYFIRIRKNTGESLTSVVIQKSTSDYYTEIALQAAIDAGPGDLFMFGDLNKESQDLIVLSIEPSTNKSARLTLMDYGITDTYNIFTDYQSLSENTVFETQISLPPVVLQQHYFGDTKPVITGAQSDYSIMQNLTSGTLIHAISVSYINDSVILPASTKYIEAEYSKIGSNDVKYSVADYSLSYIRLNDVEFDASYKIRLRYMTDSGAVSLWSNEITHTVAGTAGLIYSGIGAVYDQIGKYIRIIFNAADGLPATFKAYRIKVFKTESTDDFWNSTDPAVKVFETSEQSIDIDLTTFLQPRLSEAGIKYRFAYAIVDKNNREIGVVYLPDLILKTISP